MRQPPMPRTPRLDQSDPTALRGAVRDAFTATFERYTALFDVLRGDEAFYRPPISLRHPLIFYFGHTATFFVNKLVLAGLVERRLDPALESLFAVGVDEMSWDDLGVPRDDWPAVAAVRDYRARVRELVLGLIDTVPLHGPIDWDSPWWPIVMGIEHERIHLETSSVLMRQHRLEFVRPHPDWAPCRETGPAPANALVPIPARRLRLGRDHDHPVVYGWDNEFGEHHAEVAAFEASRLLVSNGEFLGFVDAGGYADDALWSEEGRAWRDYAQARHPTFWVRGEGGWRLRLMCEEVDMPWNWPVETNFHEARAFCAWKARETGRPVRLPTEDEWQAMRLHAGVPDLPQEAPARANLELDHWASSCPVDRFSHGELCDAVGNVWQWVDTTTYPFPGFEVHRLYDDFTVPTFDDRHNLIKGGSWISCGNQALPGSRYAFRRHFFQHAGLRYVVGGAPAPQPASHYETDALVSQYCEFHYGPPCLGVPSFPVAIAELALEAMQGQPLRRALDIGCAVGRSSLELARRFEHVTAVDFSTRFIGVGSLLAAGSRLRWSVVDEGELSSMRECGLEELGLLDAAARVEFLQGDACNLRQAWTGYDLVVAANLIDRLYAPARFLRQIHERIVPGGLLVIASPYTWLEEHTRRDDWIGGFRRDGEAFTTLDGLRELLRAHFEPVGRPRDVPFVIRETRRKFQHSLAEATVWRRLPG